MIKIFGAAMGGIGLADVLTLTVHRPTSLGWSIFYMCLGTVIAAWADFKETR